MLKIGLTGGIGSGKSTVTEIFASLGISIIDADQIAHQLTQQGGDCYQDVKQLFGSDFINKDGELDRKKIAQVIFTQPSKKKALENILHPKIKYCMQQQIAEAKQNSYVILAIPLLFESNFTDLVDRVLVIDADDSIRIQRVAQRDQRSATETREIINNQISRAQRLNNADDVIENNHGIEELRTQVTRLHQKYLNIGSCS